jgi:hypothetical protein
MNKKKDCPIMVLTYYIANQSERVLYSVRCSGEDCAWWDEHNECCSFNAKSIRCAEVKVHDGW